MKRQGVRVAPRRDALSESKKREMVAVLVRNRGAFDVCRPLLSVRHVRRISDTVALVWKTASALFDRVSALPPRGALRTELIHVMEASPDLLGDDGPGDVEEFLAYLFDDVAHGCNLAKSKSFAAVAIETCRQFVEECVVLDTRESLLQRGTVLTNPAEALEAACVQLAAARAVGTVDLEQPFADGWDTRERVHLFTTGVPLLDDFMGGGWRGGEVLLFLGPFGSCKTLVTAHGAAEGARYAARIFESGESDGGRRPMVVLIFTEGDKNDYRERLLSHTARVPRATLASMRSVNELSKSKKPGATAKTAYEKVVFKAQDEQKDGFRCEFDRVADAVHLFNNHLLLLNCSGSTDDGDRRAAGGIEGIVSAVNAHFRRHEDAYPLCFWLDHASALADRMSELHDTATGTSEDAVLRAILKRIPLKFKDELTVPYCAPAAIMHQMSGEANSRKVTAAFHHTDAEGCKSIGKYVDFAVVTSPTDDQLLCRWECTKHRREPPTPHKTVRVVGEFSAVRDVTDEYVVAGRVIVKRSDLDHYAQAKIVAGAAAPGWKTGVDVG